MFAWYKDKLRLPTPDEALPGRAEKMPVPEKHHVNGQPLAAPFPDGIALAMFGMGCFWGAERRFWQAPGIYSTAVGYAGGHTPNPSYEEVCTGLTGHNEVVRVAYDTRRTRFDDLLKIFWENHDPTQGMRQGNDVGTQYRSAIYTFDASQKAAAIVSAKRYQRALAERGYGPVTTEIVDAPDFFFAEPYHQQYLAKNPRGYCGLGGCNVNFPEG